MVEDDVEKNIVPIGTSGVPCAGMAVREDVFYHEPAGTDGDQGSTRKDTPSVRKRVQYTPAGTFSGASIKVVFISFPTTRLVHGSAYPAGDII